MELDKTEFHELMIPYITNVTAEAVTDVRKSPGLHCDTAYIVRSLATEHGENDRRRS